MPLNCYVELRTDVVSSSLTFFVQHVVKIKRPLAVKPCSGIVDQAIQAGVVNGFDRCRHSKTTHFHHLPDKVRQGGARQRTDNGLVAVE